MTDDSAARKAMPLMTGCVRYFPDALMAVAQLSVYGNDKHNPGQPLHWSRGKSNDHADCAARHMVEPFGIDLSYGPERPVLHAVAAAWRALANAQVEIETLRAQGKWPLKRPSWPGWRVHRGGDRGDAMKPKWTKERERVYRAAMRRWRLQQKCLIDSGARLIYWGALVSAGTQMDKACAAAARKEKK